MRILQLSPAVLMLALLWAGCMSSPSRKEEVRVAAAEPVAAPAARPAPPPPPPVPPAATPAPTPTPAAPPAATEVLERGKASWYGAELQGRLTASGEPFDKDKLTAAHPKLKFGTLVKVVHPENGKSVVVRINDRFPGAKGRVIDLSEAAFAELAPTARGVIEVELYIQNQP